MNPPKFYFVQMTSLLYGPGLIPGSFFIKLQKVLDLYGVCDGIWSCVGESIFYMPRQYRCIFLVMVSEKKNLICKINRVVKSVYR